MGKVIIQKYTTETPISMIGEEAGICWNADTTDQIKNYRRGLDCLSSGHMRTAEYPQVYMILEGYSARVIREFYTHIAGGPTRLQASTRYIDYNDVEAIVPHSIEKSKEVKDTYENYISIVSNTYKELEEQNVPREDIANILPIGMTTKVIVRTNLRHLIDMSHQRLCNRAYWEFRQLMLDIMKALCEYSGEWETIVDEYFIPKCDVCSFCTEKKCCGRRPTKDEHDQLLFYGKQYKKLLDALKEAGSSIVSVDEIIRIMGL